MERDSNLIVCPLSEETQRTMEIDESTPLEAWFSEDKLYIRVVDESEFELAELDDEKDVPEGAYALGRIAGQLEGFKEGYRNGYSDGIEDRDMRSENEKKEN